MLESDTQLGVYLAYETQELLDIYGSVRTATNTDSATSAAAGMYILLWKMMNNNVINIAKVHIIMDASKPSVK